jgi:DNA-binding SARP family transcriptional activator
MTIAIHLLGKPTVERDGTLVSPPKGRKAWGLLAYLLLSDRPPSREQLAALLFGEADDPLGALRWNLAELRRLLGDSQTLRGEHVELNLPGGTFIDVRVVTRGTWLQGIEVPGLGRNLLGGMDFPSSPAFESWLLAARLHLNASSEAMIREAALARLGSGRAADAAILAARLVELNPLDEGFQALLIRSLASAGDVDAATRQLGACVDLFRRDLGIEPGQEVTSALEVSSGSSAVAAVTGRTAARAQLEAGEAAIRAGAVEAGLQCLRGAVAEAHAYGDLETKVQALVALGSGLIHAVRSRDEEGAVALHEAISLAASTGQSSLAAAAHRELGYVEMLRGRYERAEGRLAEALALAGEDISQRAWALGVLGVCLLDGGRYARSLEHLEESVELAEAVDDPKLVAWATSFVARANLLRNSLAPAREAATFSLEVARKHAWTSFLPLPESLLAGVDLQEGALDRAFEGFQHAFALGCQLGDPCWEGMAGRGLGLVEAARGNVDSAMELLADATVRCVRLPDAYLWIQGYSLDALCGVAVEHAKDSAKPWINDLESLAGRTGMRELLARAFLHRGNLGDGSAFETAALVLEDIDNPALAELLPRPAVRAEAL